MADVVGAVVADYSATVTNALVANAVDVAVPLQPPPPSPAQPRVRHNPHQQSPTTLNKLLLESLYQYCQTNQDALAMTASVIDFKSSTPPRTFQVMQKMSV